jgi:hypothetical protein
MISIRPLIHSLNTDADILQELIQVCFGFLQLSEFNPPSLLTVCASKLTDVYSIAFILCVTWIYCMYFSLCTVREHIKYIYVYIYLFIYLRSMELYWKQPFNHC